MAKAVIDMGSNSFKLLIGKKTTHSSSDFLYEEKKYVSLPSFDGSVINTEQLENSLINTILYFIKICNEYNCKELQFIATSYFRNKKNAEWISEILHKNNILSPLHILSGKTEAYYIAKAVMREINENEDFVIMDIGGGSIEFIEVKNLKIKNVKSFDIGVRRWHEKLNAVDGLKESDKNLINKLLEVDLNDYLQKVSAHLLVGSAGSFETFYSVLKSEPYTSLKLKQFKAEYSEMQSCLEKITLMSEKEKDENEWIEDGRKKFIQYAAHITTYVFEHSTLSKLKIASHALKEGYLIEEMLNK